MESKTYSIPNISCMHCVNKVQETILALEGVDFAETDLTSKQLEVEFEAPASDQLIRKALIAIGFPAK
jgi:copper chaperone